MGRPKGGMNNYYSKETIIKIVREMIKENLSQWQASEKFNQIVVWKLCRANKKHI